MRDDKPGQKGTYGRVELPVAQQYVVPKSRRGMLLIGALAIALVLAWVGLDWLLRQGRLLSNGPLSSAHARLETECGSCHSQTARAVTDEQCAVCHEKYGDELGVYSFGAHYVYRSDDFRRLVESEHEVRCFGCHLEHEGREASLTAVADRQCFDCHAFASFNDGHPQFDFAAEETADSGSLAFPHIHHVREVMKEEELDDLERACLYCHNAQDDGRSFDPIDFDRHCDACHLAASTATPALPVRQEGSDEPGVETLEAIVARRGAATRWALYTNPNEFRRRGGSVSKGPVHHRDPWVLENLRALRNLLYPDAGLADLLTATPDGGENGFRPLYREAIATLEDQVLGLRGRPEPEVQGDLARIEALLKALERAVEEPYTALDESQFLLAFATPNSELAPERAAQIETLAAELTQPCLQCHTLANVTIQRVQADQRLLRRAEFDHRSHIIETRCLDCHGAIPIAENARTSEKIDPALDRAEIQNLPTIEVCQQCHNPRQTTNACITCHYFHPNKGRRSDLLLYLE